MARPVKGTAKTQARYRGWSYGGNEAANGAASHRSGGRKSSRLWAQVFWLGTVPLRGAGTAVEAGVGIPCHQLPKRLPRVSRESLWGVLECRSSGEHLTGQRTFAAQELPANAGRHPFRRFAFSRLSSK